jgi:hypothetical protein
LAVTLGGAEGRASAIADPTFQIDPTFPYANDFQLVFSDVGTPVPEPNYWASVLMVTVVTAVWRKIKFHRAIHSHE